MLSESRLVEDAERHPQNDARSSYVFLFSFVFQAGQSVVLGNQSNDAGSVEIITVELKCPLAAVPVGWGAHGKLKR